MADSLFLIICAPIFVVTKSDRNKLVYFIRIIKKHKAMDENFQNKSTLPEFVVRQGENTYIQGESMTIFFPSTFLISNMVFDGFTHNA